jgi:hypothetical protein
MLSLAVLAAPIAVWVSPGQLERWVSLEESFSRAASPGEARVAVAEREAPPGAYAYVLFGPPGEEAEEPASLRYVGPKDGPLAALDWNGAPQVKRYVALSLLPGEAALVETGEGAPFLAAGPGGLRWALALSEENRQFLNWPALPYAVYASAALAAGEAPEAFAAWEAAPVPRGRVVFLVAGIAAALFALSLLLFARARRPLGEEERAAFARAITRPPTGGRGGEWRRISFSRPLAGFLVALALQFLLFLSLGYFTDQLIPNYIQPFPLADGIWGFVVMTFEVAWYIFDLGTRDAFVRFFAERRQGDPAGALKCAQFYVWWQLLSGAVQISLISLLALGPMPRSSFALYAWPLLFQVAAQWPGVQNMFAAYFQAAQRFDYAQTLDLIGARFMPLALAIPSVLIFRAWGAAHPAYGEAMGAVFGLGVASYLSQALAFGLGLLLARRAGLPVRPLFYAAFDKATARTMLGYGVKLTFGQLPNKLSFAVNNYLLKGRLLNYSELLGIYSRLDGTFLRFPKWSLLFYSTGVPALAEAFGGKKPALARYYVARFWQYGALFTAILFAFIVGVGTTYVRYGLEPQWARIADYVLLVALIGLLLGPSWLSDALQQGAGRAGLFGGLVFAEQLARVGLLILFIGPLQFKGFLLAIAIPLALKTVVAWTVNHFKILKIPFYAWPHLFGPALVLLVLLGLFSGLAWLAASPAVDGLLGSRLAASILFFAGGPLSLVLGFGLAGFFGLFDETALDELSKAAAMTGALSPLARALPGIARRAYRRSPFAGRFRMPPADEAAREAEALERRSEADPPGAEAPG